MQNNTVDQIQHNTLDAKSEGKNKGRSGLTTTADITRFGQNKTGALGLTNNLEQWRSSTFIYCSQMLATENDGYYDDKTVQIGTVSKVKKATCTPSLCVDLRLSSLITRVFESDFREVAPGRRDRWLDWITSVGAIMK